MNGERRRRERARSVLIGGQHRSVCGRRPTRHLGRDDCPGTRRTGHCEAAVERLDAVSEPAQPRAACGVGATHPIIGDLDHDAGCGAPEAHSRRRRVGVLDHVGQCFGRDEVRREGDGLRQAGTGLVETPWWGPLIAWPARRARRRAPGPKQPGGSRGRARAAPPATAPARRSPR